MDVFHDALESVEDLADIFDFDAEAEEPATANQTRKRKTRDDEEDSAGLGVHMILSEEERRWALALKEALAGDEEAKQSKTEEPHKEVRKNKYGLWFIK